MRDTFSGSRKNALTGDRSYPMPGNANGSPDTGFPDNEGQVQIDIMRQQDEQLDQLAVAVNRIGDMGKEISEEIEDQGRLLDDLDDNFSSTRARMGAVHSRLNAFIQETSRGQLCTIAWLSLLFLVLLFLLITTT